MGNFKINIAWEKGKTFKLESDNESFIGKKIGDVFGGSEVSGDLSGYTLKITGTSDKSGFAGKSDEQGPGLRKVMLKKGKFFHKVKNKGVRKKKSVRGNEISSATVQINTIVVKPGNKRLEEIFGEKKEESKEEKAEK